MGTVWAGRHVTLGRMVAIKFVHEHLAKSPEALRRFDLEAKAAARIESRHAATVHDHGVTPDGLPYIVMEYLEGESLEAALRRRGPLPLAEAAEIVAQAARALGAAHEAGIVHRDLKPDNVFLANDPEAGPLGYTVKLVDFGIAKIVQDEAAGGAAATQAGAVLGTPHYMSPEALTASAPVTPASDLWSLGAVTFAIVTGRTPFTGDAIGDVVLKVCAAPIPVPSKVAPGLSPSFDAWFAKACSREASKRFASAEAMARSLLELERWAGAEKERQAYELEAAAPNALELDLPEPGAGRGRGLAIGLVLAALAIGGVGYYAYQLTEKANRAVQETAASAAAVVEAENEKKLREAEQAFWGGKDAGPDAAAPASRKRKPR